MRLDKSIFTPTQAKSFLRYFNSQKKLEHEHQMTWTFTDEKKTKFKTLSSSTFHIPNTKLCRNAMKVIDKQWFLTLCWTGVMEGYLYWYIGSLCILTNACPRALTIKQVARKVLFPPCLIEHISLSPIKKT